MLTVYSVSDRVIYDMSPLAKLVYPPKFSLPNYSKVFTTMDRALHMLKLDLENGFYHLQYYPKCRKYFGVKCNGALYRFTRLPMFSVRNAECI